MSKELKKAFNVRLYPTIKEIISKRFGSIQKYLDLIISKEIGEIKHKVIVIEIKAKKERNESKKENS